MTSHRPALALTGLILTQVAAAAAELPNAWQITDSSTAANTLFYYTDQLTSPEQTAATNSTGGFHMTVVARMVDDLGGPQTMVMAYGMGNKRFLIWWDLDNNTNLVANLDQAGIYTLTTNGTGRARYHTHEIIYNPTNGTARYVFDGQVISNNWSPSSFTLAAGEVRWGASAQNGRGMMNFNRVTFAIMGTNAASYDAGTAGNPAVAPNPTNSVTPWTLFQGIGGGTSFTNISPDATLLPVAATLEAPLAPNTSEGLLKGLVNPSGSPTLAWFEWGTDTNYGNVTVAQSVGQGVTFSNIVATPIGAVGGPTYHYRLVASNAFGVATGTNQSFNVTFLADYGDSLSGNSSTVAWGDHNNNGRLDALVTGAQQSGNVYLLWDGFPFLSFVLRELPGATLVDEAAAAWGDYDNDGRLDFALAGFAGSDVFQLWRNTTGAYLGFSNVTANVASGLPGVRNGSVAWGDYDNDGRLDLLLAGLSATGRVSQIWRNTGNGFSNVTASVAPGLPGVNLCSAAWADYNNDGRLDLLLAGLSATGRVSQIWRNTGHGFSNVTASVAPGLPGVNFCSLAWGDYDNDGWLDFLLTGLSTAGRVSQLWRNTGNGFNDVTTSVAPGLSGLSSSTVAWGDYDNDGRTDLLLTGEADSSHLSQLWRNTGNGFSNVFLPAVQTELMEFKSGNVAWGDHGNDGKLDFLLSGYTSPSIRIKLLRNNMPVSNAPPSAPAGLSATTSDNLVSFNWSTPSDDHTPGPGLNYNVRIGTTPGGWDVLAPMALTNGWRQLPAMGNARTNSFYNLPAGNYYWSVQAIDTSFAGSPFAPEQQFTIAAPRILDPLMLGNGQFQFFFTNLSSATYEVLTTTNLSLPVTQWSVLGVPTPVGGGGYQFTNTVSPNEPSRFYLLRRQ